MSERKTGRDTINACCFVKIKIIMKKIFLMTITLLSVVYLNAQVKSFDVISSKTYENNTRTSYIHLDADLDAETAIIIEKELEQHPDISRFSFYAKPNLSKCMFTTNISVDEQIVVDLMNDAIFTNTETTTIAKRDFRSRGFINNLHVTSFALDFDIDSDLLQEIMTSFKENDLIIDVDYDSKSRFKISSNELIYPQYIEDLLLEWEIEIVKEDIK